MTQATYKTKFDEWLTKQGIGSQKRFIAASGIPYTNVSRLRGGKHPGNLVYAALIEDLTKGEVKAEDVLQSNRDKRLLAILRGKQ
jgi:DNA-binding transcriptional regulator YdaS (Cro superfamily)